MSKTYLNQKRTRMLAIIKEIGKDCSFEQFNNQILGEFRSGSQFKSFLGYYYEVFGEYPRLELTDKYQKDLLASLINSEPRVVGEYKMNSVISEVKAEEVVSVVKADIANNEDLIDERDAFEAFAKILFIAQRVGIERVRRYLNLIEHIN